MIKYEFVFRDNIAIIRDKETGEEIVHQALRPTWGEPERWVSEEQAREWAHSYFWYYFEDVQDPTPPEQLEGNVTVTDNTTPGA